MTRTMFQRDPYVGWATWLMVAVIGFSYGSLILLGVFIGWLIFSS